MNKGSLLFFLSLFTTTLLYLLSNFVTNNQNISPLLIIGQFSGLILITLVSFNFFLSIRTKFLENLFSGLDKVYKLHKLIGKLILFLIFIHPLSLYFNSIPFLELKDFFLVNTNNLPYMFGILGFYTLLIIIFLTLFVNIPYKLWKRIHQYVGLVILFGGLHVLLIGSSIASFLPLKIWVLTIVTASLTFYIYKRYLYYLLKNKDNYEVVNVVNDKNYVLLTITPINKNKEIYFLPGQFAFFSLTDQVDEHPFSVWDIDGNKVTIGIKKEGSFTNKLASLKIKDKISVNGPFGVFGSDIQSQGDPVFISAGIGITPFYLLLSKVVKSNNKLVFINSMHSSDSNMFVEKIKKLILKSKYIKFLNVYSDKEGRITKEFLENNISNIKNNKYYICGPVKFMKDITTILVSLGVKKSKIAFEDFTLK